MTIKTFVKRPSTVHNFITRVGNKLYDGVTEYYFAGCNVGWLGIDFEYGGGFAPPPTSTLLLPSVFRINNVFSTAQLMGSNVIRMGPNIAGVGYADSLYSSLGTFNETVFARLDYTIATARNYGIRLIFPFVDSNENYYWGSKASFSNWGGTNFYTDPAAIANFKIFIYGVINRVNTVNGITYKDDPAILAWETVNEGNPPATWTSEIASYIKSVDPKHLIVDGYTPAIFGDFDLDRLLDENIDIVADHYYPMRVSQINDDLGTSGITNKVFAITEFDWASTRAGGDTLVNFLSAIESYDQIKGSLFWNLSSRNDADDGWAGYQNDYTIACPDNIGLDLEYGREDLQVETTRLTGHIYRVRRKAVPI
jgi:mannan endo-1,4-beta-mannosidase